MFVSSPSDRLTGLNSRDRTARRAVTAVPAQARQPDPRIDAPRLSRNESLIDRSIDSNGSTGAPGPVAQRLFVVGDGSAHRSAGGGRCRRDLQRHWSSDCSRCPPISTRGSMLGVIDDASSTIGIVDARVESQGQLRLRTAEEAPEHTPLEGQAALSATNYMNRVFSPALERGGSWRQGILWEYWPR